MRGVSKNKFLLCFRPVVDLDVMLDSRAAVDRSSSCRFACISGGDKDNMRNSDTKSLFLDKVCPKFTDDSMGHHPPKRTLSRVIKTVVFETILNRRGRHKNRYRQGSNRSYSTYTKSSSTGDEKSILSQASVDTNIQGNSSSSCSSPVSDSNNLSESYATEGKQRQSSYQSPLEKKNMFDCWGLFLVLISLTLTVLLGKLLGIILTSTWLYLLPLWDASYQRRAEMPKLWKREYKLYKNKGHNGRSAGKIYHKGH